jgi:glycerol-1-phosphate dehydrogenase [NAD(P)+]
VRRLIPLTATEILGDRFLGSSFICDCGSTHTVATRLTAVERGIVERVPELLDGLVPWSKVLIIADQRTWEVAGAPLARGLGARRTVDRCVLDDPPSGDIHASVDLVDTIAAEHPGPHDLLIAVGSGTVNDLTKALAHRRRRPYAALATAASMNGFTSAIVALLEDGLKTTAASTPPVAVFADPEILCQAPIELSLAGLGDLISKPFCGCDWKIASLVRDEPWCPTPGRMLSAAFDASLENLSAISTREPQSVTRLFELLLVSGLSMTVAGTSSPASGGEHLLSHYWDMTRLRDGRALNLHGAQVGVASVAMQALYERVDGSDFAAAGFSPSPTPAEAEAGIRRVFGGLADAVWPQWRRKLEARSPRDLDRLRLHEAEIRNEIETTLDLGRRVCRTLAAAGAPTSASDLGISNSRLEEALLHARKIRPRYTVLDVAAEVGLLGDFARDFARREGP